MEFLLQRDAFSDVDTLGTVVVLDDGAPDFRLQSLELPWMEGANLTGQSCILPGRYELTIYNSPHLKMEVLLLHDVPGRDFVEVHPGNRASDLRGCIAPGRYRGPHCVIQSREAFLEWKGMVAAAALLGQRSFLMVQNFDLEDESGSSARA